MSFEPPASSGSPKPMELQPHHFEPQAQQMAPPQLPPRRRSRVGVWILTVLLVGSIIFNFILLLSLGLGLIAARPAGLQEIVVENPGVTDSVAVIRVEGLITDAPLSGWGGHGTDTRFLKEQVDAALGNGHVKAVVLKVDSPGGSATASAETKNGSVLNITPDTVSAWSTPRVMMLWRGQ